MWLYPYEIIATGPGCGLLEFVRDGMSIDAIKSKNPGITLNEFFEGYFIKKEELHDARMNFARSLAGYSLVTYVLRVADRHNGNIIVDKDGHIIHIDFGFILTSSPGGHMDFEKSPFKLTEEYVEVLDGLESEYTDHYRECMYE